MGTLRLHRVATLAASRLGNRQWMLPAHARARLATGDPFWGALIGGVTRLVTRSAVGSAIGKIFHKGVKSGAIRGTAGKIYAAAKALPGPVKTAATTAAATAGVLGAAGIVGRIMSPGEEPRRRYRRMNPANIRALKRAIRRVQGFEKVARQCIRVKQTVRAPRKRRKC